MPGPYCKGPENDSGNGGSGVLVALWAALDFGVHVDDDLLEDDVDSGAPLVCAASGLAQVLSAVLAEADFGDLNALHGAGVCRARLIELFALTVATPVADRGLVLGHLRRRTT